MATPQRVGRVVPERARHTTLAFKTPDSETQEDVDEDAAPHDGEAYATDDEEDLGGKDGDDDEEEDKPFLIAEEESSRRRK